MAIKESNLVTITSDDLDLNDYVRVLDGNTSRKITVQEFLNFAEQNVDALNALPLSGGTLSGDLTINKSAPTLTLSSSDTTDATIKVNSSSSNASIIEMGDVIIPTACEIKYDNTTNALSIKTNTSLALTIDNNQKVTLTADLEVGGQITSDLDLGSNKITNVADPTAAQDVATKAYVESRLPYETGSWTIEVVDSAGNSSNKTSATEGTYVRIGNNVVCYGYLANDNLGSMVSTNTVRITGLPFNAKAGVSASGIAVFSDAQNLSIAAGEYITGKVAANNNYIDLYKWDSTTGTSGLLVSELTAGFLFTFVVTYQI